jgi:U3 small nucleolar RNA-associated protein 4
MTDDHQWMWTHVFNLDMVQHHTTLPSFPQCTHALVFAPSAPSLLILSFANHTLELYDIETCQFPPWSCTLCAALPKRFTHLHGVTLAPAMQEENSVDEGSVSSENVLVLFWEPTWLRKELAFPLIATQDHAQAPHSNPAASSHLPRYPQGQSHRRHTSLPVDKLS